MSLFSEACRYLGYGKNGPDALTGELIEQCLSELSEGQAAEPKAVYLRFPLEHREGALTFAGISPKSKSLERNLQGCNQVFLFCATLGSIADRQLKKYSRVQISKAAVFQAAAAAYLEEYCNRLCRELQAGLRAEGEFLRPRFSPGYGDFSLEHQARLLDALEAGKRIGVELTSGGLMLPEKTVSAVIGISRENNRCPLDGCEICPKKDCAYRRTP